MELEIKNKFNFQSDKIYKIENNSDPFMDRIRVFFKNGYKLSIIWGECAYCDQGSFEIAILNIDGGFCPHLFEEEDQGDDILGNCSFYKVNSYIENIGNLAHLRANPQL